MSLCGRHYRPYVWTVNHLGRDHKVGSIGGAHLQSSRYRRGPSDRFGFRHPHSARVSDLR
eukprot:6833351-Pyramimonas_sp.AAC.1